ncbi:MAG: MTAP family purine nucleoside phosphorylase [Promethearchaeota archaeon]|jgi:5'-methylthioadenosine phosphorylase
MVKIGIIGGSGLDDPEILKDAEDIAVDTPYGKPSSQLKIGKINEIDVILIARHGREHTIPPTQVNYRANIHSLKDQGCSHILATTACGSLREEIERGDLVILDQFIDFTRLRKISFFEEFSPGDMKHTPMADPYSNELREILIETARELNIRHHESGTVVTIEGPRFSTRAESNMFRIWGADVINMSIAPETILANEAGVLTWEEILEIFGKNVNNVIALLTNTITKIK